MRTSENRGQSKAHLRGRRLLRLPLSLAVAATLSGCGSASEPTVEAAKHAGPLVREAAVAVQTRFPGQLWSNVREKAGMRENAVCAEIAGQQVIYRGQRKVVMAQGDFGPEWTSLYQNWCIDTPYG